MRTITLEEYFVTNSFLKATGAYEHGVPPQMTTLQPKLLDIGAGRIAAMDESGIDFQALSLAGMGFDSLDAAKARSIARETNSRKLCVPSDAIRRICDVAIAGPKRIGGRTGAVCQATRVCWCNGERHDRRAVSG
jgi:hypothetical protein